MNRLLIKQYQDLIKLECKLKRCKVNNESKSKLLNKIRFKKKLILQKIETDMYLNLLFSEEMF